MSIKVTKNQYLMNAWMDFGLSSHLRGGEHIDFGVDRDACQRDTFLSA